MRRMANSYETFGYILRVGQANPMRQVADGYEYRCKPILDSADNSTSRGMIAYEIWHRDL